MGQVGVFLYCFIFMIGRVIVGVVGYNVFSLGMELLNVDCCFFVGFVGVGFECGGYCGDCQV